MQIIRSKAPARIDLAGGTLDLWPLYLFFNNATTINCAIDQFAEVRIEVSQESKVEEVSRIELQSEDRNEKASFRSYGELLESFQNSHKTEHLPPSLWLHARVLRHFFSFWRRSAPLKISTKCAAPAGAGLGGSSALNIALCSSLLKLTQAPYTEEELIPLARDLETTVIDVPAGIQDYWPALHGGIQAIRMEPGRVSRKVFNNRAEFLESHLVLCYSGQSRNSGINNWSVYKKFIDGDATVKKSFSEIAEATFLVEEALERQSFEIFAKGIQKEWFARQQLAPTIATVEMLQVMQRAQELGSATAKVCGAGGGGCFILIVPSEKKQTIQTHLRKDGIHVLDFNIVEHGCVVMDVQ